jgi:hypothetical protein
MELQVQQYIKEALGCPLIKLRCALCDLIQHLAKSDGIESLIRSFLFAYSSPDTVRVVLGKTDILIQVVELLKETTDPLLQEKLVRAIWALCIRNCELLLDFRMPALISFQRYINS